jgi:hypothetical protein
VARKGDLKVVLKMNVALEQDLAKEVDTHAVRNERNLSQEVRFALRKYYGLDRTPAEASADVSV